MAQVPYQAYPDNNLQDVPIKPNVSGEAFGVGAARAIEGAGKQVSGVGDEMWSRAVALKQLDNETEAKEADTQYMIEAGKLHAEYSAKEGKERYDATDKYFADLQSTRQRIRAGLSNDMARRMYDSSSLSTMGRSIFNGAGMAASAHRQWVVGSATAQMAIDAKDGGDSPFDDAAFAGKIRKTENNASTIAAAKGFEPDGPQAEQLRKEAISMLWKQRLQGMVLKDAKRAGELLDANRASITDADQNILDKTVRAEARSSDAVKIGNRIFEEGMGTPTKPQMPLEDMRTEVRDQYLKDHPGDDLGANHAVQALNSRWNQQNYSSKIEKLNNIQTVEEAIGRGGVNNIDDLKKDPVVADAIRQLEINNPKIANDIPGRITRVNAARDKPTQDARAKVLYGLATHVETQSEFVNLDMTKEPLRLEQMKEFQRMQKAITAHPQDDPRTKHAMEVLKDTMGPQMVALHVDSPSAKHKNVYYEFRGGVYQGIRNWMETHDGKPPTDNDIRDTIGPGLIRGIATPGFLGRILPNFPEVGSEPLRMVPFTSTQTPFFKTLTPPAQWMKDTRKAVVDKGGVPPSDQELLNAYARMRFQEVHGAAKK